MGDKALKATTGSIPAAEWVAIDTLAPWDKNPRRNDEAAKEVAKSIQRFGFGAPILARSADRVVIAGHTRLKAAALLKLDKVPVRFLDLDPAEARALALADNKLGELAEWDAEILGDVLRELEADGAVLDGLGFSEEELRALMADPEVEPSDSDDDAPEVDEHGEPDSVLGGVYELGPHRLVCGSSTDAASWASLMLPGEALGIVWTDPPYGVNNAGGSKDPRSDDYRSGDTLENDDLDAGQLTTFLRDALGMAHVHTVPGGCWYVAAPAGPRHHVFGAVLLELDVYRHDLVWVKDTFVFGRSEYHYRHEPIFFGWKPGAAHYTTGDRTADTVLEVPRPKKSTEHPTMKPVELVVRCLERSSPKGAIVGEPFGGSGTTLIAAAQTGRVARLIELDPRYCDVIRRRWTRWAREHGRDPGPGALDG